jgi:hypothetical protein
MEMPDTHLQRQISETPGGLHLMATAMMGKTDRHLRDDHGAVPTDDKRENARLHVAAHARPGG